MKLCYEGLQDRAAWQKAGILLPAYDWKEMCAATEAAPTWVHFGPGNIFRAFLGSVQQELLNKGLVKSGIVAVSNRNAATVNKVYSPYDCMTMLVTLMPDGTTKKEVVASIARALRTCAPYDEDVEALKKIFRNPSLQMVSFTITEKGYALKDIQGNFMAPVLKDFENGPSGCGHAMCQVAAMLLERYRAGGYPMAVVSMDNCSHNGEKLRASVMTVVEQWLERGHVTQDFADWVSDEAKISFPWTMIDKITPRSAQAVADSLTAAGVEDMQLIETGRGKYDAPFVNAEESQYLVIEDRFPNGRPPLEKAGVYMTDRDTVNKIERMKVTTCLNPLHTALAVYGCLLGYRSIAEEMKDVHIKALVEKVGYTEGLPVVVDPKILSPKDFIYDVINHRLPNPFIPDSPQRIAEDTSQKVGIRYGETIKSYMARPDLEVADLTYIPLVIAGWLRYLLAVDDKGEPFTCSNDPMLSLLQEQLHGITLGNPDSVTGKLEPILTNATLFGVNLVEAGLSGKIEAMLRRMLAGPGAVRETLAYYLEG